MAADPDAILLLGPTASGKTPLALALARTLPVEIVSVDSAQVYRGMDVGTAKSSPAERKAVPHHLIDVIDPTETYSAARFRADALRVMSEITARGKVPLLVGGTMLYFKALRDTSRLEGKCGACEYKEICGGSRARSYALTGDPLAQEPCCIYQPRNWHPESTAVAVKEQSEFANPFPTL